MQALITTKNSRPYVKGSTVTIKEDDWQWGGSEIPPVFCFVKWIGNTVPTKLLEEVWEEPEDPLVPKMLIAPRKYVFKSSVVDTALENDGTITIDIDILDNYIEAVNDI